MAARGLIACCAVAALLGAAPAPLPVELVNHAAVSVECHAVAGHWYGFDLGTVATQASTELPLDLDRATGTVSMQNTLHQAVPIQWIYCGRSGDAWRTRAVLPLRRLAQSQMSPAAIICRDEAGALRCD